MSEANYSVREKKEDSESSNERPNLMYHPNEWFGTFQPSVWISIPYTIQLNYLVPGSLAFAVRLQLRKHRDRWREGTNQEGTRHLNRDFVITGPRRKYNLTTHLQPICSDTSPPFRP